MARNFVHPQPEIATALGTSLQNGESLRASQSFCSHLTRHQARNFYWGFVALPEEQRMAIYALYAFARQVDDDADLPGVSDFQHGGHGSSPDRFAFHRDRLQRCFDGLVSDPVMHVLAHAIDRYGIPRDDLEALIRGVEHDLKVSRYESWDDLRRYCLLVASSVGRMCVRIFGFRDSIAFRHADDLGIAMQLANMLRDVREDAAMGRVYLPQEDLRRFGMEEQALLTQEIPEASWEGLMEYEIERARGYFESGLQVTEHIPRRAAVCVLTMAGIYRAILDRLAQDPRLPLRQRASLTTRGKLAIMLRSWLQAV